MIGISTYAYQWRLSDRSPRPLTLAAMLEDTAALGLGLIQLCDYPPLETMSAAELDDVRERATRLGIALEVGTKGIEPQHLRRFRRIASRLGSPVVRSMLHSASYRPDPDTAERDLRSVLPDYDEHGVTLALETYEQVPTATLVEIVRRVGSRSLGICLDPGNVIAALEHPAAVAELTAPYVANMHVKDFSFTRNDDMVGFRLAGCPLGEGLLDYDHLIATVRPEERGISQIIEQWCPWQGSIDRTVATETAWVRHAVDYLGTRSRTP